VKNFRNIAFVFFLFGLAFTLKGSAQQVSSSIDRDTIKIGEQIIYTITAKVDPDADIQFPEGQTFIPLELVEAYKIDTTQLQPLKILSRQYALTQFDSGSYNIGKQTVIINGEFLQTDSLRVHVNDVVVDTTKQKLFPIKTYIDVEKPFQIGTWIWWTLLAIALVVSAIYLFFNLKKKKDEKKKRIPPYQQAILALQELDNSKLIDDRNLKEYYSKLTEISRRYLEEKVEIRALEYTSNELVDELESRRLSKKLNISQELIDDFKKVLQRADLAKFAKAAPDMITAKEDRQNVENFTHNLQSAIPEPTEEEKRRDEAYQELLRQRRRNRRIAFTIVGIVVVLVLSTIGLVATKGYDYVKDAYFGNPSKELLEGEWVNSNYGYPPMYISTPQVLVRQSNDSINKLMAENDLALSYEAFEDGTVYSDIYTSFVSVTFKEGVELDFQKVQDLIFSGLEKEGAVNILSKDEEFRSLDGSEGTKLSGSFTIKNPITQSEIRKSYQILLFQAENSMLNLMIIYNEKDRYADEIANRIVNTVEFKTQSE
jgi:hypothetical protein